MLNIKKIRPTFTSIITTMDTYDEDQVVNGSNLIDTTKRKGTLKEFQTVVAIGPMVKEVKVGEKICVNPQNYAVKKHREGSLKDGIISDNPVIDYRFNTVEFGGNQYLLLQDRDINYVIEDYEEVPDPKPATTPSIDIGNRIIV